MPGGQIRQARDDGAVADDGLGDVGPAESRPAPTGQASPLGPAGVSRGGGRTSPGRLGRMSLSRSPSPSLASSSMHAEVMCLLTEAISNAVCWVTGTPCSGTAQPAVAELTSSPAKYTPTARPGSSSPASELTKAGRPEASRRPRRSRVTSADMTANVSWSAHAGVLGGAAIDDIISYGKDPQRGRWPRLATGPTILRAGLPVLITDQLHRAHPRHHH